MNYALGLVETKGLIGAIEAADAMVKAADVSIINKEYASGALVIIKIVGETSAVKAAVEAGAVSAQRVGQLISSHVIPRPDDQLDDIINNIEFSDNSENQIKKTKVVEKVKEKNRSLNKVSVEKKIKIEPKESDKPENNINEDERHPTMDELIVLNVHSLRRIARSFDNFPIKGREISKANRNKLLDYFKDIL